MIFILSLTVMMRILVPQPGKKPGPDMVRCAALWLPSGSDITHNDAIRDDW